MQELSTQIKDYLNYCKVCKRLSSHTLKAYRIDLNQYLDYAQKNPNDSYVEHLTSNYNTSTAKRKIASLKGFFNFSGITLAQDITNCKFRKNIKLPRVIPLADIEKILSAAYKNKPSVSNNTYAYISCTRDIAILELLFATGMRVSEICSITIDAINLDEQVILVKGKGNKERIIGIPNDAVIIALQKHIELLPSNSMYLFLNRYGKKISDQSIRNMIRKYAAIAGVSCEISPHMFRHTFATELLNEGVDIRYIQQMLGHSSITTTQIYTHVSTLKQKQILIERHPRGRMSPN